MPAAEESCPFGFGKKEKKPAVIKTAADPGQCPFAGNAAAAPQGAVCPVSGMAPGTAPGTSSLKAAASASAPAFSVPGAGRALPPDPSLSTSEAPTAGGCPILAGAKFTGGSASNEEVNPLNMMPEMPQSAAAGQAIDLSKEREVSNIPNTASGSNWVYPSPQQFYNALLRKNKVAEAETMEAVVRAHNVTNEISWTQILEWERLHNKTCPTPTLMRFVGKPHILSWGAFWSSRFSYRGAPFDRHDWFVDRCGQRTVRYVIDYYDDPRAGNEEEITVEARPACDNAVNLLDRLRRPVWHVQRVWGALFGPVV